MPPESLIHLLARVLRIPPELVTPELSYQSIPEWDSLKQVELMVALETAYGLRGDLSVTTRLTSVRAIEAYVAAGGADDPGPPATRDDAPAPSLPRRGLNGVVVDTTRICDVDGERGRLLYRGYRIEDLARSWAFEGVAGLILHGERPTAGELSELASRLSRDGALPAAISAVIAELRAAPPMAVLRTCVSALGAIASHAEARAQHSWSISDGIRLIAQVASIVGTHGAVRRTGRPVPLPERAGLVERLLASLTGVESSPQAQRAFEIALILQVEHSSNASTFAARIATGTQADLHAAITAAMSTFGGPVHGGAIERVLPMVRAIGTADRAGAYVEELRRRNEPVTGFGHRVYRVADPRAVVLRDIVRELAAGTPWQSSLEILEALEDAMAPYSPYGLRVNVDYYSAILYGTLGIPEDFFAAVFATARTAGWIAHVLEQSANNILIRPILQYVGPPERGV